MNPRFTKEEAKVLRRKLRDLERVCQPKGLLTPKITFKKKEEFGCLDLLETYQGSPIEPSGLAQMWEPLEHLEERGLGFVEVNKEKWFYDKVGIIGRLFSQDGTKGIFIEFPLMVDTSNMWSLKETLPIVKSLIKKCQKNFPPVIKENELFPDTYCQKLYNTLTDAYNHEVGSINKSPEVAVMAMVESLRRILIEKLKKNNLPLIQSTQAYQEFLKKNPNNKNILVEFLRQHKNLAFMLSERAGYIKNAKSLIVYQQIRDSVRHPDEVPEIYVKPQQILEDFYQILQMPSPKSKAKPSLCPVLRNMETQRAFGNLLDLENILLEKADPKFKEVKRAFGHKAFWQELEQQKVLTKRDSKRLQKIVKTGNCVAHNNRHAEAAKTKLIDKNDAFVSKMILKLDGLDYYLK